MNGAACISSSGSVSAGFSTPRLSTKAFKAASACACQHATPQSYSLDPRDGIGVQYDPKTIIMRMQCRIHAQQRQAVCEHLSFVCRAPDVNWHLRGRSHPARCLWIGDIAIAGHGVLRETAQLVSGAGAQITGRCDMGGVEEKGRNCRLCTVRPSHNHSDSVVYN